MRTARFSSSISGLAVVVIIHCAVTHAHTTKATRTVQPSLAERSCCRACHQNKSTGQTRFQPPTKGTHSKKNSATKLRDYKPSGDSSECRLLVQGRHAENAILLDRRCRRRFFFAGGYCFLVRSNVARSSARLHINTWIGMCFCVDFDGDAS